MNLSEKITHRRALVSVIGLGYVGLPLAVAFAEAGLNVIGIDTNREKIDAINRGESYIQDVSSTQLLGSRPRLVATTDFDRLADVDAAIICVPTPLDGVQRPDMSFVLNAADQIASRLHEGMLVVLESTTYPGTTEELILPRLESAQGARLLIGEHFFLAFSPERTDPGRTDWTLYSTPKVIGGVTPRCLEMAQALYRSVVKTVIPVSSTKVAETAKLLENTFRAVNIGMVNELAIMCDRLGVDVWEVIDAAGTKPFGFMPFYPGPGTGGHCIPIDPLYLVWKMRSLDYEPRLIQASMQINDDMPRYILARISSALKQQGKTLKGSNVIVLGVSYKPNTGDTRKSPALDLLRLLKEREADVSYHDPYVPELDLDDLCMCSVALNEQVLQASDCVVIVTPHTSYDWKSVVENSSLVLDTRNALKGIYGKGRVVKL
jgi:UDP-N-acetyl-D-glucosamine dehydrogenase